VQWSQCPSAFAVHRKKENMRRPLICGVGRCEPTKSATRESQDGA
jgi:hypothetical protein